MNTQIIYVTISSDKDVFLEELWVSAYSARLYNPNAIIKVLVDKATSERIKENNHLHALFSEVITVSVPEKYSLKERSRELKTRIREIICGNFLYIDTDTIICRSLENIDQCESDVAGIPDSNICMADNPFAKGMTESVKNIFGTEIKHKGYLINGGVIFAKDSAVAHELFKRWNKNWTYSCFEKGNSQDQPALWQSDYEMGNIIETLPGTYNSQVSMSLQYFADAAIVHFLHMDFIPNQDYSPYLSLQIYKELKKTGILTDEMKNKIINCKAMWAPMTIPVGKDQMLFLFTAAGRNFVQIYKEGGVASWLMIKMGNWLPKIHKRFKKK